LKDIYTQFPGYVDNIVTNALERALFLTEYSAEDNVDDSIEWQIAVEFKRQNLTNLSRYSDGDLQEVDSDGFKEDDMTDDGALANAAAAAASTPNEMPDEGETAAAPPVAAAANAAAATGTSTPPPTSPRANDGVELLTPRKPPPSESRSELATFAQGDLSRPGSLSGSTPGSPLSAAPAAPPGRRLSRVAEQDEQPAKKQRERGESIDAEELGGGFRFGTKPNWL
jgi:hypothetical protein